jgi:cell division protein ZapA (FtsZ GTPase activity inhibitor)
MQAQEKLSVKVHIAGRLFPLMVIPQEESAVRQAAKDINEKLAELKSAFAGLDEAHLLSMLTLDLATRLELLKNKVSDSEPTLNRNIDLLEDEINRVMGLTLTSGQPA